jgi:uncharacterized iron-regulated protein
MTQPASPLPVQRLRRFSKPVLLGALLGLGACEQLPPWLPPQAGSAEVLLMGEQHDQPDHQRQIAAEVQRLTAQGRLAALVLEMVESGRNTAKVRRTGTEAEVRLELDWDDRGWPWATYGSVVMTAVRAGVPVLGGNLPRSQVRATMADPALDGQLSTPVRNVIAKAVEDGHCGMLKAEQLPAMVRVQIARDRRMAETAVLARAKAGGGQVVLLHAGEQHVARDRGVPLHLDRLGVPPGQMHVVAFGEGELPVDERRPAQRVETPDHCAEFRAQMQRTQPAAAAASQAG